jgi:hypothetical protein
MLAVVPDVSAQVDAAAADGSSQRGAEILRQVTNLFLSNAERFAESQIDAFDGFLVPLIERTDAAALAQISEALCGIDTAPRQAIRKLAFHEDPLVAGPVLKKSSRLSDADLVEIAETRGQQHLLAICDRKTLNEALTDMLLRYGDVEVSNALARNAGAKFSECGYATLVGRAERDESLTEKLGLRLDIPANLLRELISKAADVVLARFLTAARPVHGKTRNAAAAKAADAAPPKRIDYTKAQEALVALNRAGKLNDSAINRFAVREEYTQVVAALALKVEVKPEAIEPFLESERLYGLIVACKAARLDWSTTKMIIRNRPGCPPVTQRELEQGLEVFNALILSLAQWTIRFGSDRILAKRKEAMAAASAKNVNPAS